MEINSGKVNEFRQCGKAGTMNVEKDANIIKFIS